MSDIQTLRQYLVGLGFQVNNSELRQFTSALRSASKLVKDETGNIGIEVMKWQGKIVGMFGAVAGAVVAAVDKVAQGDQDFRLFGERMFMSTQNARQLKIALDALHASPGDVAFDPELRSRYLQLQADQKLMGAGLGGDYESTMRQIRDVRFEFTRFNVELQYLLMGTVKELFQALGLGNGNLATQLHRLNDWIITNLPKWSKVIANDLVPVLKDAWMIFRDIAEILQDLASIFDNVISLITGDDTLAGVANFDKFARSVEKVVHFVALLVHWLTKLQGTVAGATIGSMFGPEGTIIGGGIGLGVDLIRHAARAASGTPNPLDALAGAAGGASSAGAGPSGLKALAAKVGADLGIDPAIIYAQWSHETGNFSNRGATALNNFAGINVPGGTGQDYRSFASPQDFATYYESLIKRRYSGALGSQTPEQFAAALKAGGYYSDSLRNYASGMRSHMGDYARGGGSVATHISVGDIYVNGTNLSGEQVKRQVADAMQERAQLNNQKLRFELQPVVN